MVDRARGCANIMGSVVFDLLNVSEKFGMLDDVVRMAWMGYMWMKDVWKRKVWDRSWELDRGYWKVQIRCHQSLDLMSKTCGGPEYSVWWQISDSNHAPMGCCEIM